MSNLYDPSVDDVAALIPARTFDNNGAQVGTFNDDTRPSALIVTNLIAQASAEVMGILGTPPASLNATVASVIATLTAMKIELGFFPEQVTNGRSPYAQLASYYELTLGRTEKAVSRVAAGEDIADEGAGALPVFGFPEPDWGLSQLEGRRGWPAWRDW